MVRDARNGAIAQSAQARGICNDVGVAHAPRNVKARQCFRVGGISDQAITHDQLFPIPYSLFPIPYPLSPIPYPLSPIPYSLFPIPYSL